TAPPSVLERGVAPLPAAAQSWTAEENPTLLSLMSTTVTSTRAGVREVAVGEMASARTWCAAPARTFTRMHVSVPGADASAPHTRNRSTTRLVTCAVAE